MHPVKVNPKARKDNREEGAHPSQSNATKQPKNRRDSYGSDSEKKKKEEEDFRTTWKRAPKVSNRLPSAFMNKSHKAEKIKREQQAANKLKDQRQAAEEEQPQMEEKPRRGERGDSKMVKPSERAIPFINSKDDPSQSKTKSDRKPHAKIKTVKQSIIPFINNHSKLDDNDTISTATNSSHHTTSTSTTENNNNSNNNSSNSKHSPQSKQQQQEKQEQPRPAIKGKPVRLEHMITLGVLKTSKNSGAVKKMLHAPTLKLFAVKEAPVWTKAVQQNLKNWFELWRTHLNDKPHLVGIHGTFWNSPEGCVSVVLDHENGGSLQNLLEATGSLPELCLREIAHQILMAINELHANIPVAHGGITPSQILFDKDGHAKLTLGLGPRINSHMEFSNDILTDNAGLEHMPGSQNQPNGVSSNTQKMVNKEIYSQINDIFDFGYMLLVSAIGGLEIISLEQMFIEHKKYNESENYELFSKNLTEKEYCCMIHFIQGLEEHEDKMADEPKKLTMTKYMKHKFTPEFLDFLCSCLRFKKSDRKPATELMHHPLFKNPHTSLKSPKISLHEILKVNNLWTQQNLFEPHEFHEKQLDRICDALTVVLPFCDREAVWRSIEKGSINSEERALVIDIAEDLAVPEDHVLERLDGVNQAIFG